MPFGFSIPHFVPQKMKVASVNDLYRRHILALTLAVPEPRGLGQKL
jgi:hypothetical protein